MTPHARLTRWTRWALHGAALVVFFLVPWWLRIDLGRTGDPYFVRFVITLPLALTLILWALLGFGGWEAWVRVRLWALPWLALCGWAYLSINWASQPDAAWDAVMQFLALSAFALAMATAGPPPGMVILALGAGVLIQGAVAIGQTVLQNPIGLGMIGEFSVRPGRTGLSVLKVNGSDWMRPYGLTMHPNALGGFFAVALLTLLAGLIAARTGRRLALLIGGLWAFGVWALLLTFSRSAWGGLVVGGAALLLIGWRLGARIAWRRVGAALAVTAALAVVFTLTYPDLVFARAGVGDESNELRSITDRVLFTEYALRMIRVHPFKGVGFGMNAWVAAQMIQDDPRKIDMQAQSVHNLPLLIGSELGLIGFVAWGVALVGAALILWRAWRAAPPDLLTLGLAAGALAMLVVGLLDWYPWGVFHYALLWTSVIGVALHAATTPTVGAVPTARTDTAPTTP